MPVSRRTALALPLLPWGVAHAQAPTRGGALTFALSPEPPLLLTAINTTLQMGMVASKMMEPLLTLDVDFKPRPVLAESWTISDDGLAYTFKLRPNVKWHDGRAFSSADVQYTILEVLKKLHPRGRSSFASVIAVDTPDPLTAILRLSAPAPPLLVAIGSGYESPMLPRHIFEGTDVAANPASSRPIGTGPFVFREWQKGSHIILDRNPSYWDAGKPYLDRIVYRIINDASARAAGLESGEIQLAGLSPVPLTDMARLEKLPSLSVETRGYAYMSPFMLMEMNLRRPPLNDVRVRRAIAHAVDRARMTQLVWMGYGKPAVSPVPSTITAFHTADLPRYDVDLDAARRLLDEAGYRVGAGGRRFKLMHDFVPLGTDYQRTGEFIRQQLGRIGIEVELRSQDLPTYFRRVYTDYDFDFNSCYYGAFADPTQGVQRLFWSKSIQKGVVFTNPTDYRSEEMDRVIEAAQTENDVAKRRALYADMQRIAMTDLSVIPLMELRFITVASSRLKNHTTTADGLIGGSFADAWLDRA